MATESTLPATIIARARNLTDSETSTPNTDHVKDSELLNEINVANRELVDIILSTGDAGIDLLGPTSATIVAPWDVPSDLYRLVGLDIPSQLSTNEWVDVPRFHWRERNNRVSAYPRWRLYGRRIQFQSATNVPTQARVWYIPQTVAVTLGGGDTIPTYNGWDDFVVGCLGIFIATKENMPLDPHMARKNDAEKRIRQQLLAVVLGTSMTMGHTEIQAEEMYDRNRGF
jgi:hypothetical protein